MKKHFHLTFVFLTLGFSFLAQSYEKNNMIFKASYGFISTLDRDIAFDLHDFDKENQDVKDPKKLYTVVFDAEYFLNETFSVSLNFSTGKSTISSDYDLNEYDNFGQIIATTKVGEELSYTNNTIYLLGNYHMNEFLADLNLFEPFRVGTSSPQKYPTSEKLDMYVSSGLGYRKLNYSFSSSNPNATFPELKNRLPIRFLLTVGFNYEITKNIAVNVNAFLGNSVFVKTGIAYKILQE